MNLKNLRFFSFCLITIFSFGVSELSAQEASPEVLRIEEFRQEVQERSLEFLQAESAQRAAEGRAEEGRLLFSPRLGAESTYRYSKDTGALGFPPAGTVTRQFEQAVSLSKNWASGTLMRLSHFVTRSDRDGLTGVTNPSWQALMEFRVEQGLWSNFLGKQDRAQQRVASLAQEAESLRQAFQKRLVLFQAESVYWNAALSRSVVETLENSLQRTRAILDWNKKRQQAGLADRGDVLQSEAATLELQQSLESAKRLLRELYRQLSLYRGQVVDETEVRLEGLAFKEIEDLNQAAYQVRERLDFQAIDKLSKLAEEEAELLRSSVQPDLNLFGSLRSSTIESGFGDAEKEILDLSYPQWEVGAQLSLPLDFAKNARIRDAARALEVSKRLERDQRLLDLERSYQNLVDRYQDLKARLRIQTQLIETQSKKLKNEDERFRQGRSSSFQILSFEDDLSASELQALELSSELRLVLAELELFSSP